MVDIQSDVSNVSQYRNDVFLSLQRLHFSIDDQSSTNYCTHSNWPRGSSATPTVAILRPLIHERRSSVSAYACLRSGRRDTVPCTPVAGPSHSCALGAKRRYVLLTTYIAEAAISWQRGRDFCSPDLPIGCSALRVHRNTPSLSRVRYR